MGKRLSDGIMGVGNMLLNGSPSADVSTMNPDGYGSSSMSGGGLLFYRDSSAGNISSSLAKEQQQWQPHVGRIPRMGGRSLGDAVARSPNKKAIHTTENRTSDDIDSGQENSINECTANSEKKSSMESQLEKIDGMLASANNHIESIMGEQLT